MSDYNNHPKTYGVSYKPWLEKVRQLFQEKRIQLILSSEELHRFYHEDCSPEDVYHIQRIKSIRSAVIDVKWYDKHGRESVLLVNNEEIRRFYRLNPRLKQVMENKKSRLK